jgi:RHS repeat-associated protein
MWKHDLRSNHRFFDKTTGLQNNLNRWYDASVGRWLSEDPIGFTAGDVNLYRYVGNGPVNGTDPSGLQTYPLPAGPGGSPIGQPWPGSPKPSPWPSGPSGPSLYCHYLTPGNSAPADPWYLNWGSEAGFGTGIVTGGGAIGIGIFGGGAAAVGGGLSPGAQQVLISYGSRPAAMAALAQLQAIKDALPRGSEACIRLTHRLDQFEAAIREAFPLK